MDQGLKFDIEWVDRGHPPRVKPNPEYPDGKDVVIDPEAKRSCLVKLPYPTGHINVGTWIVTCSECGLNFAITAASRPDDPRSVLVPCKERPQ